jgi:Flp pilus assembly protein TadG
MPAALKRRMRRPAVLTDLRGVAAIEFAIVAPVFLLLIIGSLDLGQLVYAVGVLDGAVEKAARDSAIETGDTAAADAKVRRAMRNVLPGAEVTSTRKSYFDFKDVERPERWNDANNDGTCSTGESYVDENQNGQWDADIGKSDNGGANDVVIYTVTVRYDSVFSVPLVPMDWTTREITSTAVRKNQPYALQAKLGSEARTC